MTKHHTGKHSNGDENLDTEMELSFQLLWPVLIGHQEITYQLSFQAQVAWYYHQ
jgi:hypothetical protein